MTFAVLPPLRLSIVVPTFNESPNIRELLRRLEDALGDLRWEIIFVDDDSPDGTAAQVREIGMTDARVRCLHRIGKRGLASACIDGMLASTAPIIAVMDADLQHDERILPTMLAEIEAGGADLVIGSRYAPGGGTGEWSESRKAMSRLATRLCHAVLPQPVSDPVSGYFMLRRQVLDCTVRKLSGVGFKILFDILATAREQPLRVAEAPYHFRNRYEGESKLDGMVVWEFAMLILSKVTGRAVPVRFIAFSVVGGMGVFVHMAVLTVLLKGMHFEFVTAQACATGLAMMFNFAINNILTYRDQRLRGANWVRGLASFMIACSIGALANVGIASYLFENHAQWALSAFAGVLAGAVWNFAVTQLYTWGRQR